MLQQRREPHPTNGSTEDYNGGRDGKFRIRKDEKRSEAESKKRLKVEDMTASEIAGENANELGRFKKKKRKEEGKTMAPVCVSL